MSIRVRGTITIQRKTSSRGAFNVGDLVTEIGEFAHSAREEDRDRTPADGIVTSRDAEAGSTVVAGQAVLKLADPASLWVKLRLDQGRSGGLAPGLPAKEVTPFLLNPKHQGSGQR